MAEISTTVKKLVLLFFMLLYFIFWVCIRVDNISLGFGFERHVNIVNECNSNTELLKYFVSMIQRNTIYVNEAQYLLRDYHRLLACFEVHSTNVDL